MSEYQKYFDLIHKEVALTDSTNYFMRAVSTREFNNIKEGGYSSELRYFMMIDYCIPAAVVSWIHFNGGPKPGKYNRAILLTPQTVETVGLLNIEPDTDVMEYWYPAVQLTMNAAIPRGFIRDATGLVNEIASTIPKSDPVEIIKVVSQPIPIQILESLPTL